MIVFIAIQMCCREVHFTGVSPGALSWSTICHLLHVASCGLSHLLFPFRVLHQQVLLLRAWLHVLLLLLWLPDLPLLKQSMPGSQFLLPWWLCAGPPGPLPLRMGY